MRQLNQERQTRKLSSYHQFTCCVWGVFVLFAAGFAWMMLGISGQDEKEYQALMQATGEGRAKKQDIAYTLNQKRLNMRKDIKFTENHERKQLLLFSEEAELVVDNHHRTIDMTERLKDVRCYMQEELYYKLPDGRSVERHFDNRLKLRNSDPEDPNTWIDETTARLMPWQTIRYLAAENAIYTHGQEIVEAKQVAVFRYVLPGHQLIEDFGQAVPSMHGIAESVSFSVSGKELNFKASKLKATLTPQGR